MYPYQEQKLQFYSMEHFYHYEYSTDNALHPLTPHENLHKNAHQASQLFLNFHQYE